MAALEPPLALLDLADGQSMSFRVRGWQTGETVIRPPHAPEGKTVRVLRLLVDPRDKPDFPPWLDITAAKLFAQLHAEVQRLDAQQLRFTVTAHGFPPKKSFTVVREPVS